MKLIVVFIVNKQKAKKDLFQPKDEERKKNEDSLRFIYAYFIISLYPYLMFREREPSREGGSGDLGSEREDRVCCS